MEEQSLPLPIRAVSSPFVAGSQDVPLKYFHLLIFLSFAAPCNIHFLLDYLTCAKNKLNYEPPSKILLRTLSSSYSFPFLFLETNKQTNTYMCVFAASMSLALLSLIYSNQYSTTWLTFRFHKCLILPSQMIASQSLPYTTTGHIKASLTTPCPVKYFFFLTSFLTHLCSLRFFSSSETQDSVPDLSFFCS